MNKLYQVRVIIDGKVYGIQVKAKNLKEVKQYCAMYINGEVCSIDFIEVV